MEELKKEAVSKEKFDEKVLSDILKFNENLDSQLISKSNLIFGASTLTLLFVLNHFVSSAFLISNISNFPLIILLLGSFLSSFISMMVILPKLRIFSKKKRDKEDVFYYKNILKFYSREEYVNCLKELPKDNNKIAEAYAHQIYSLSEKILPYKFKMLKIAGWSLIITIFLSIISYFVLLGVG